MLQSSHHQLPKHISGSGQTFTVAMAWALQRPPTEAEYKAQLLRAKSQSPPAVKYFDDLKSHNQVYQYTMTVENISTHGFKTCQIVEGMNGFDQTRLDVKLWKL